MTDWSATWGGVQAIETAIGLTFAGGWTVALAVREYRSTKRREKKELLEKDILTERYRNARIDSEARKNPYGMNGRPAWSVKRTRDELYVLRNVGEGRGTSIRMEWGDYEDFVRPIDDNINLFDASLALLPGQSITFMVIEVDQVVRPNEFKLICAENGDGEYVELP